MRLCVCDYSYAVQALGCHIVETAIKAIDSLPLGVFLEKGQLFAVNSALPKYTLKIPESELSKNVRPRNWSNWDPELFGPGSFWNVQERSIRAWKQVLTGVK